MEEAAKYLKPSSEDLRRGDKTSDSDILFDTTARNLGEDYTFESLADVINPFESFFTLQIKKQGVKDTDALQEWRKKAQKDLFTFIVDSTYFSALISDKRNYDTFGFSGMSIVERRGGGVRITTEDPFDLVISDDRYNDVVDEVYWVVWVKMKTLIEEFEVPPEVVEPTPENNSKLYAVLCCLVPNKPYYIDNPQSGHDSQFVYATFLLGGELPRVGGGFGPGFRDWSMSGGDKIVEIGERKYFKESFMVVPRDVKNSKTFYGAGLSERLLTEAQNLNQLRADVLRSSNKFSDPPIEMPFDIYAKFETGNLKLENGTVIPKSHTGESISPIVAQIDFRSQVELLQYENFKIKESVPVAKFPEKKARQSQFEIDQTQRRIGQLHLIYKVLYLKDAVAKHLNLIFKVALKQGKLDPLPEGFKPEDVEPSLSNILLREYLKIKAQAYVKSFQMSFPYVQNNSELMDTIDDEHVVKSIFRANGAEDAILSQGETEEIRKIREEEIAAQRQEQEMALQLQKSQTELNQAKANEARTKTLKEG